MNEFSQSDSVFKLHTQACWPRDLGLAVHSELLRRGSCPPPLEVLVELFESMYFASLKTEESEPVLFHVAYVDSLKPDPKPPKRIVHDRWRCVPFAQTVPLSSASLTKIAPASDPRTSSFAVCQDSGGRLVVWGLIDQGNSYHDYVNFDSDTGPERPGLFQASILGIGHLVAYIAYEKIAELRKNALVRAAVDVFQRGKVRDALDSGMRTHIESLRTAWPEEFPEDEQYSEGLAAENWLSSIRRLLLRVQNIGHGGAFLITPDKALQGLLVKHKIAYDRLSTALQRHAVASAQQSMATLTIGHEYIDRDLEDLPVGLYLEEAVTGYELEEIRNEIGAIIWFISLLTRVDGLVLLSPQLEVQGFGVEITVAEEPSEVYSSTDAFGLESGLKKIDYQHYGTRHRSMMRYCAKFPGSIGFVISQDGDVRAMTHINGRLLVWENLQLQLPGFVKRKRARRRHRRRNKHGGTKAGGTDATA